MRPCRIDVVSEYVLGNVLNQLLLVLSVLLLVLLLCQCFNLLSDNKSNTIRVIWYFVMLYNLVSFAINIFSFIFHSLR